MQIEFKQQTIAEIPKDIYQNEIEISGRIERIGNEIMFDWANVTIHCHIPIGETQFYFRGEGINLMKIVSERCS